ncbi:MAG: helicase-related protein [Spirochaetes bacterium]|nr:helicase-related protein [Spirochaetota bacterium]
MRASARFTPEAAETYRRAIADARGNEVFASGKLDEEGLVSEIVVAARGHRSAVPALASYVDRGDVLIHNHPSGSLEPSDADLGVASLAGDKGAGSYIVDNEVREVYVVAEPARRKALRALDADEIAGVLETGGKLASRLPDYEPRASQIDLTRRIAVAFNEGFVLAAEAGTGVGKSFAYLLPAFAWAARNKERVVVSTATINLQRQLVDKDIPVVAALFRNPPKAVLVKGRGNYLCWTRMTEALDEEGLFATEDHPLRRIASWAEKSSSGDRADLSFWPEDGAWGRVCSEADACLGLRCAYRERCFVLRMKREASDADLIVANHHILFSDLAARMDGAGYEGTAVLPPFTSLIFDEAHSIEASATDFFSRELTRFQVLKQLSSLYRTRRDRTFGLLPRLQNVSGIPGELWSKIPGAIAAARDAVELLDVRALPLFGRESGIRVTERTGALDAGVFEPLAAIEKALVTLVQILKDALEGMPDGAQEDPTVYEARLALRRLADSGGVCASFRGFSDDPDRVYWIERGRTSSGDQFVRVVITPLDISGLMHESVFGRFRTVVCVSATLAVAGGFGFWKNRVGLGFTGIDAPRDDDGPGAFADGTGDGLRVETGIYPSPFPYDRNVLLALASDAPFPDSPDWQDYINGSVQATLRASKGHALVLFTSYDSLRKAFDAAKPGLDAMGITALRQGDNERSKLLDAFKTDSASVLFATDSFWEGVDAPGDTLQVVIICKLPFRVPTDPVQKARAEAVERRGGNAFMDLSLPEAVIRFKQGFGRLIRHSEDRGAVVVLDGRILRKQYGRLFISSLPECGTMQGGTAEIAEAVGNFLGRSGA